MSAKPKIINAPFNYYFGVFLNLSCSLPCEYCVQKIALPHAPLARYGIVSGKEWVEALNSIAGRTKKRFLRSPKKKKLSINDFIKECHSVAKSKGWWMDARNEGELIALMHSEISEALEAMRNHGKQEDIAEELADCCIRIFDYCGARNIDLQAALEKKAEKNKSRPYRHGKKF